MLMYLQQFSSCSTQLFREFKLCKLLLRPLDDRYSASRGSSRQIRGYSRQSESYVSSLSNSADNSAHDEIDDEDIAFMQGQIKHSELFKYQRPGSRAVSVPTRFDFAQGNIPGFWPDCGTILAYRLMLSVHPSICPSVCLTSTFWLTFALKFWNFLCNHTFTSLVVSYLLIFCAVFKEKC